MGWAVGTWAVRTSIDQHENTIILHVIITSWLPSHVLCSKRDTNCIHIHLGTKVFRTLTFHDIPTCTIWGCAIHVNIGYWIYANDLAPAIIWPLFVCITRMQFLNPLSQLAMKAMQISLGVQTVSSGPMSDIGLVGISVGTSTNDGKTRRSSFIQFIFNWCKNVVECDGQHLLGWILGTCSDKHLWAVFHSFALQHVHRTYPQPLKHNQDSV